MSRRQYKNPPIDEALVELRLAPGAPWDLTKPGALQERLGDAYRGHVQHRNLLQANIQAQEGQPPSFAMRGSLDRVLLSDQTGTRIVGVGPNVLSIHALRPYRGWIEDFRPRVVAALDAYGSLCPGAQVARIGVRFINRIALHGDTIDMLDWFRCGPMANPDLPGPMTSVLLRTEFECGEQRQLLVTFGSIESDEQPTFLLDLDVFWEGPEAIDLHTAQAMLDELRDTERSAFEALITDRTREIFDGK